MDALWFDRCSYLSFLIGVKIGHGNENKGRDERGDNPGDNQIRNVKVGIAGIDLIGLGQNERTAQQRTKNPADRIAALCEIDARHAGFRWAKNGGVRIGDRLDESESAGDQSQSQQKHAENRSFAIRRSWSPAQNKRQPMAITVRPNRIPRR